MDVVLEVLDTYLFDHLYAAVLPSHPAPFDLVQDGASNISFPNAATSTWQYKPSTVYFSIEPGPAAYQSMWARDNIYREATTLFLITWYAPLIVTLERVQV